MSDSRQPQDTALPGSAAGSGASGCGALILILVGIVLLLPGLCSLGFMIVGLSAGPGDVLREPGIIGIWLIGFAVAFCGISMIRLAIRGDSGRSGGPGTPAGS